MKEDVYRNMYIPKGELCQAALKMNQLTEFKGTTLNLSLQTMECHLTHSLDR